MKRLLLPCILSLMVFVNAFGSSGADTKRNFFDRFDKTEKEWKPLAEQGSAFAQLYLGWMYHKGNGAPKNFAEAMKWYRLAAEQGVAEAHFNLGEIYYHGQGVPKDYAEARKWYSLAADKGFSKGKKALKIVELKLAQQSRVQYFPSTLTAVAKSATTPKPAPPDFSGGVIGEGLGLDNIKSQREFESGVEVLIVRGKITNTTQDEHLVPMIRVVLYDANGEEVQSTVVAPLKNRLPGGAKVGFIAKLPEPSDLARTLEVTFAQVNEATQTTVNADVSPPRINMPKSLTVDGDTISISGHVTDDSKIADLKVEGRTVKTTSDGKFNVTMYVPTDGLWVHVEATDIWNNRSEHTVKIIRSVAIETNRLSLASLNPTRIDRRSNKDAIALVIGVAKYSRAPNAAFADNDANVFGDYAHRALGVPRSNIKVLVNDKASLADVRVAVKRWLRGRTEEGLSDVFVFFAGHGLASLDGKDLYLLPFDGAPSLLDETALLRRELFEVIREAKPRSATVFLDTCYSGLSRGKETLLASARPVFLAAKQQSVPEGFTVLSAASGQQISSGLDEVKHGLFSYYLMKGMEGNADANKDRKITARELHAYLGKNVRKQAIRLGREQTPELSGDGERVLVRW